MRAIVSKIQRIRRIHTNDADDIINDDEKFLAD